VRTGALQFVGFRDPLGAREIAHAMHRVLATHFVWYEPNSESGTAGASRGDGPGLDRDAARKKLQHPLPQDLHEWIAHVEWGIATLDHHMIDAASR